MSYNHEPYSTHIVEVRLIALHYIRLFLVSQIVRSVAETLVDDAAHVLAEGLASISVILEELRRKVRR